MDAKIIAAGLAMTLLAGCTDATIHRMTSSGGILPKDGANRNRASIGKMVCSKSRAVVAFSDHGSGNVWVAWNGSRFFPLGQGDVCVTPNGRYVIVAGRDRPDHLLIADLGSDEMPSSTVRVSNLPPNAKPEGVECDDIRAVVQYHWDGAGTDLDAETCPRLWKQIRLVDLRVSEATEADYGKLMMESDVLEEEDVNGERQFKMSKDLAIIEKPGYFGLNRIFLESGGKRMLLVQEDWLTRFVDNLPTKWP